MDIEKGIDYISPLTTPCQYLGCIQFDGDDAMILDGDCMHLHGLAHIINLVVNDGLHAMSNSVVAIGNTVQYVRSSIKRVK